MGKKKIEDRMLSQIIYRSIFDIIDDETGNPSYRKYFDKVLKDIFGIDGIITSMMLSTNQFKFIKKLLADNEYKAFCQMMLRDEDVRSMKDLVRVAYDAAQIANKPKKRVSTNDIKAYRYLTKLYIKSIEAMRKKYKTDKSSKKAFKQKYSDLNKMLGRSIKDPYHYDLGYSDDDFIITVVAETNKNKNQSFLIRQVPVLMEKIPHLKVLFLGKETLPDAHNLVNEMGLQNVCQFLGYRKDVELFTKISNICFSASIREGLPVNIIEAMACGKVCICSTNRGHNSLIQNNFNGLIFNLDDPSEMVDEILKVYSDKTLAKQLADNSYNESKKYDVKDAVEFTARVYKELISLNH